MEKVDLGNNNSDDKQTIIGADGTEREVSSIEPSDLRFQPTPRTIFAVLVEEKKTKTGIILPEGYNEDKNPTPIVKVLAIGSQVKEQFEELGFSLELEDFVYINPNYAGFAMIDGIQGMTFPADAIHGKVTEAQ